MILWCKILGTIVGYRGLILLICKSFSGEGVIPILAGIGDEECDSGSLSLLLGLDTLQWNNQSLSLLVIFSIL